MLLLHKDYHSLQTQITGSIFSNKIFFKFKIYTFFLLGDSVIKNLSVSAVDCGSIPGLEKSPGGGNGNSL